MQIVIQTSYELRDKIITSYFHYPKWTSEIEETMCREFDSIKSQENFKLSFKVSKN